MSDGEPAPGHDSAAAIHLERRAYVRLAADLAAVARPAGHLADLGWLGRVRDISCGGVGLLLRHRFQPGTRIEVELRASTGAALRTVSARVAHSRAVSADGAPYWLHGCAFDTPLTDEEVQALL
jgi:hypothetical protein